MKNVNWIFSIVSLTTMFITACGGNTSIESEGNSESATTTEVVIGTQVWMTKNLDVSTFRNGEPIPEAKSNEEWSRASSIKQPAWCYHSNDSKLGGKHVKLYNWYAVNDPRGLAPMGYHIPSDKEWTILTDYLGGPNAAGTKMKSSNGWRENGNGNNNSGFLGYPSGSRDGIGPFAAIGPYCFWWSSTENSASLAWGLGLNYYDGTSVRSPNYKVNGFSVRCIKD